MSVTKLSRNPATEAGTMRRKRIRVTPTRVVLGLLLAALAVVVVYPLLWMAISGFKTNAELFGDAWGLPGEWRFSNYVQAWDYGVVHYILNSAIVTVGSIILVTLVSSFAAFALVQVRIPLSQPILLLIMGGLMLSETVALVPLFRIMRSSSSTTPCPGSSSCTPHSGSRSPPSSSGRT